MLCSRMLKNLCIPPLLPSTLGNVAETSWRQLHALLTDIQWRGLSHPSTLKVDETKITTLTYTHDSSKGMGDWMLLTCRFYQRLQILNALSAYLAQVCSTWDPFKVHGKRLDQGVSGQQSTSTQGNKTIINRCTVSKHDFFTIENCVWNSLANQVRSLRVFNQIRDACLSRRWSVCKLWENSIAYSWMYAYR